MAIPTHLALELVTPERALVHERVDEVQLPGVEGALGILPGHTPLLTTLGVGEFWYRRGQEKHTLAVASGVAEVLPDRVIVLAQVAERPEEIDLERAARAKARAEEALAHPAAEVDVEVARLALMRALTRLQVATRARTRG
jgi:F-type H+-transporting ATPase subunit epsilon